MQEISDLVKIISVSIEGMKFGVKASKEGMKMLARLGNILYSAYRYNIKQNKVKGKALLNQSQDISFVKIYAKDYKKFQKLAKQHKLVYTPLPSYSNAANKDVIHIMYSTNAAPRMESILEILNNKKMREVEKLSKKENAEEYMQESGAADLPEESFQKEMSNLYPEEQSKIQSIKKAAKKNEKTTNKVRNSIIKNEFNDNKRDYERFHSFYFDETQIIKQNRDYVMLKIKEQNDIYLWVSRKDIYTENNMFIALIDKNDKLRISNFDETQTYDIKGEDIGKFVEERYKAITISKQNIRKETPDRVMTLVPGTKGREFLWLSKKQISEAHQGKSMKTVLDKNSTYQLYDRDGNFVKSIDGTKLYKEHYDPVKNNTKPYRSKSKVTNKTFPDKEIKR